MQTASGAELPPFETLCQRLGREFPSIAKARREADNQVEWIGKLLEDACIDLGDTLTLVVFGSLARREATSRSDVDWTLLVDGPVDAVHVKVASKVRDILADAKLAEPGASGTFGTLASSHEIVHHIGGLDDTNRNMTRRLLLLLESRAIGDNSVRSRVIRAVLDRYIFWGRGLPGTGDPRLRVPRFLLNDVVRYWRTMAVDYAAKKWEQDDKKWALRNAKLRVTRKMTFVKGLLLCFDCELFPSESPWCEVDLPGKFWDDIERWLAAGCEVLVEETPIDLLCRTLSRLKLDDIAIELLNSYDDFLSVVDDVQKRKELENLSFETANDNATFSKIRNEIGNQFGDSLAKLFFTECPQLSELTQKHGVF
ncbi:MAG: hypothetical protein KDA44_19330 [Planctomycetales bacterium]|nr:hypothetical protein [Planctomycetales bacterium]